MRCIVSKLGEQKLPSNVQSIGPQLWVLSDVLQVQQQVEWEEWGWESVPVTLGVGIPPEYWVGECCVGECCVGGCCGDEFCPRGYYVYCSCYILGLCLVSQIKLLDLICTSRFQSVGRRNVFNFIVIQPTWGNLIKSTIIVTWINVASN